MAMKKRRDTAYYGGRSSIVLTEETRGAPYKWVSLLIAGSYVFFGLRNVFFCGAKLPVGAGEDIVMDMWSDCQDNGAKTIFGGLHGLGDWLIAIIRFSMAMTASTADLFFTMLLLGLYSTGFLIACLRSGITSVPWYYLANMSAGFLYENYVCYLAYMAYSKRLKFKQMFKPNDWEAEDVPLKGIFLAQALGWMAYAVKMIVSCDTPYILMEEPAQISFFNSTWHDCKVPPITPDVRIGWATMAGVHAALLACICTFCFMATKANSLMQGSFLLTFYHLGTMFLILRSGWSSVPPSFLAFVTASVAYDGYVFHQARTSVETAKMEFEKEE